MFDFEHSINGYIELQKVWALYSDVSRWIEWDKELESVAIEGQFVKGSVGIMNMKNGQSLPFVLDNVAPMTEFTTVSNLGAIVVTFGHILSSKTIKHTVNIVGDNDKQVEGLGQAITMHIAENMNILFSLSQK